MQTPSINRSIPSLRLVALLAAALCFGASARAQTVVWINSSANSTINWSDGANWQGGVPPGPGNQAFFDNNAAMAQGAGESLADSIVDEDFLIDGLAYAETNGFHNTVINPGLTLAVSNNSASVMLLSGTETDAGSSGNLYNTISGSNATLLIYNTNAGSTVIIRQGSSASPSPMSTVDLSGLDNFDLTIGQIQIAVKGSADHAGGTLILAKTNLIQATTEATKTSTGPSGAIEIYDSSANTGSAEQSKGIMELGITNAIYADVITVGRSKSPSGTELSFNPNFIGNNPTAYFRGYNSNRMTRFLVADDTGISSSANCIGTADLSGGRSDLLVNTMVVGNGQTGSSTGPITANFTMGAGTLDVNNLEIGYQNSTSAAETMTCEFDLVNGGTVLVNSNLYLGHYVGGSKHSTPTLNISSGVLDAPSGISDLTGNASSMVELANCTVTASNIGSASAPVGTLVIGDTTLNLVLTNVGGAVFANNLSTVSSTNGNIINISYISPEVMSASSIVLVQSTTAIQNTTGFNGQLDFTLGRLPPGLTGTLQPSGNGTAVQLVLTRAATVTNAWTGADIASHQNTNWSDGLNWALGAKPGASDTALFDTAGSVASSALAIAGGGPGALVPSEINNIVDGDTTVASLKYDNTNGTFQNTFIANGETLTLGNGGLTVGSSSADFGSTTGNGIIAGSLGTLNVASNSAQIYVGLGDDSSSSVASATLDMSALGSFNANVLDFLIGVGGYGAGSTTTLQPVGTVYLAQTNNIKVSSSANDASDSIPVGLEVGDAGDAETTAGFGDKASSALYLGLSNSISADYIDVGRQWSSGLIAFNPNVTNLNPSVLIGGASGSAVVDWNIGDGVQNALSGGGGAGTNDFTGGVVHALVDTLQIGVGSSGSTAAEEQTGVLSFDAGMIAAGTVNVSENPAYSDGNFYSYGAGTLNVAGTAVLNVSGNLNLGAFSGGSSSSAVFGSPSGVLNVNGGSVLAGAIASGGFGASSPGAPGGATSAVNVNHGVLAATNGIGTSSSPLTSLNLTNATIYISAASGASIYAQNVAIDGFNNTTNWINFLGLPPIERYPATITVLRSATPITLAGGVFNVQAGLPGVAGGSPYTGSLSESGDALALVLTLTGGPIGSRGVVYWNGPDGTNMNWSDANNWMLPGAPGPTDLVFFDNTGMALSPGAGAVDNTVDTSLTIAGLVYGETNGFHNTVINPGGILTVSNAAPATVLLSGTETDAGSTANIYNTISGTGAALVVQDSNTLSTAIITQGSTSTSHSPMSTLDLSGLDNFSLTVGQIQVGVYGAQSAIDHPGGTLILAATNFIQATTEATTNAGGASGAIEIYDGSFNLDSAVQSKAIMELGISNAIYADVITVGRSKSPSGTELIFNPNFAGDNLSAYFRGYNSNRVTQFLVADDSAVSSGVACTGLVDLSAGTSDLLVNNMIIGNGQTGTGAGAITATFNMGAGHLDVNNLELGVQNSTAAAEPINSTFNLTGGNVVVNSGLVLGLHPGGTVYPSASLNVTGGSVTAPNIADESGNASSAISLSACTLSLTSSSGSMGTSAQPVGSLTLSNTVLNLAVGTLPAIVTHSLTINGSGDTINLTALPSLSSLPSTITLLQSLTPIGGSYDFVLGALPAPYTAHLQESVDGTAVQLVVTAGQAPTTSPTIASVQLQPSSGSLLIRGANGTAGASYYVLSSTNVALPVADWTPVATNAFGTNGNFSLAVPYSTNTGAAFFVIKSQ